MPADKAHEIIRPILSPLPQFSSDVSASPVAH
jgi:hypothetical protein